VATNRKRPFPEAKPDSHLPFERTHLWRAAFQSSDAERYPQPSEFFRQALLSLRDKSSLLVSQIAKDVPQLTVHDISHLDALWEVGSLIAGPTYILNPAEGYVLGAAILLHDAAMNLASYPNGLTGLTQTDEWRDAVAALDGGNAQSDDARVHEYHEDSVIKRVLPEVLRTLHARQSEVLPFARWTSGALGVTQAPR